MSRFPPSRLRKVDSGMPAEARPKPDNSPTPPPFGGTPVRYNGRERRVLMAVHEVLPPPLQGEPDDPEEALLRLRAFLEAGDTKGAVAYLRELAERWPDSERVRHYLNVLDPGPARVLHGQRTGRSREREFAWLRAHARDHPGCWLAVAGGRLVAAAPELKRVLAVVEEADPHGEAILWYQPREDIVS